MAKRSAISACVASTCVLIPIVSRGNPQLMRSGFISNFKGIYISTRDLYDIYKPVVSFDVWPK